MDLVFKVLNEFLKSLGLGEFSPFVLWAFLGYAVFHYGKKLIENIWKKKLKKHIRP